MAVWREIWQESIATGKETLIKNDQKGKLFEELQHIRVAIVLAKKAGDRVLFTTNFNRWYSENRTNLFKSLQYYRCDYYRVDGSIPKIGDHRLNTILNKLNRCKDNNCY